jgi:ABC-2 type transport system permease protein
MLAVYFLSIEQILYSKNLMIELFSGLLIPINWFPQWFQTLSAWLPFQGIAYIPLSIYLGRFEGMELWKALGHQAMWAVVLLVCGRLLWNRCQHKMLIQGG